MAERTLQAKLKVRSDTATNWQSNNPVLLRGEPAFETDTNKLKFGDGTSAYNDLPYVSDDGGGVEIVDLGTPTFQDANGGQYLLANLTLTSEQAAKLKAEPAPIVKFTLSGQGGDYQNGTYYLTQTYLIGVGGHIYNTCFQFEDNGGWAITLQTTGTLSALITIYPYKIPQEVEANPSGSTSVTLEKLKVGGVTYAIPQGSEIVDLGALTFSEGASGAQASGTITQEQYNTLSASGTSPIIKFTDGATEVFCQRTGWMEGGGVTYYTYAANTNNAIPARITSYSVSLFASGSLYSITAFRVTVKSIPSGGTTGQVLKKKSNSEYDVEWGDVEGGTTFTPAVDAEGNLSWTNDGGLPNPETVNVRGADGKAATVQVGTVTTGAAGTQASVTNSGTENAAVLDITIPQGADGASGVTDVTAGTPTEQNGYTITPVTFNFEQGNSKTVNIQAKNGDGAVAQQNTVINRRTATVDTADENSPDFVENGGNLWVKKTAGNSGEVTISKASANGGRYDFGAAYWKDTNSIYFFGGTTSSGVEQRSIYRFSLDENTATRVGVDLEERSPTHRAPSTLSTPVGIYVQDSCFVPDTTLKQDSISDTLKTGVVSLNGEYIYKGNYSTLEKYSIAEKTSVQYTSPYTLPNKELYLDEAGILWSVSISNVVLFNTVTEQWETRTPKDSEVVPDGVLANSGAIGNCIDNRIYYFGGGDSRNALDSIVAYDLLQNRFLLLDIKLPFHTATGRTQTVTDGTAIYLCGSYWYDSGYGTPNRYSTDVYKFIPRINYAYSPAVVLSQEEYAQFKNILNGVFSVGISAPSAEISGEITATGAVTASNFNTTT